jgi:microcystin-dependent protein
VSSPYVGEIRIAGFNFAPAGWALANGQLVPISQNPTLYQLIGTTYGGDGVTTYALPNIQSRMPMHMGDGAGLSPRLLGQMGGAEVATFREQPFIPSAPQPPIPTVASERASLAASSPFLVALKPQELQSTISPFLVLNFIISLFGVFPSQS